MFKHHTNLPRIPLSRAILGFLLPLAAIATSFAAEPLAVSSAERRVMPEVFVTDAVIEAVHRATLAAETTGRIKKIMFDVDDLVTKGEVLLRFTDKEQQAGLARAIAAQKEAIARLRQAESEHTRTESVFARKLVAKSAVDKSSADLKAAQQRVKAAEADIKKAKEQLEYTIIRAPYAGIVVKRLVNVGERVSPGTPLMTGFSLDKLRATSSVPQSVVAAVRKHGEVSISIDNSQSVPDSPIVSPPIISKDITVYPYADETSHNFTVRAELSSVPEGFYPGMFAKALFVIGETSRLLVPSSAVVHRSEVTAVYVLDDKGRVSFRAVRIGKQFDDDAGKTIEVLAGLSEGEQVALEPVKAGVLLKTQRAE
ncbi:MAG: efflux RND transporter periplasmic adaptor subunit, partial [Gammaproteobacteria bacterium]|nr:efflux RND transporter periplasmic adaptor subunit [Gammaproteobacteria bacterium]